MLSCEEALAILSDHRPDLGVIDTQLGQETCEPVLDECEEDSVAIYAGHSERDLPEFARGRKVLGVPYQPKALDELLAALEAS